MPESRWTTQAHQAGFLVVTWKSSEVKASTEPITKILSNSPELHPRGAEMPTPLVLKDPDKLVKGYSYNMTTYTEENVREYLDLVGLPFGRLRYADTPFINESKFEQGCVGEEVPVTPTKNKGKGKAPPRSSTSLNKGNATSGAKAPAAGSTTSGAQAPAGSSTEKSVAGPL